MKTLIYLPKEKLTPRGGPLAIGYYLQQQIEKNGDKDIVFLETNMVESESKRKFKELFRRLPRPLVQFQRSIRRIIGRYLLLNEKLNPIKIDFSKYDIVHFNESKDLFIQKNNLKDYKGIVLLTSHSPIPSWQEYNRDLPRMEYRLFRGLYNKAEDMDVFAFGRADYITFPCVYAEEPYFDNWEKYKIIHQKNEKKYRYILTGIPNSFARRSRQDILKEVGINDSNFVISYVGRHNEVKGYDNLLSIGEMFRNYTSLDFLICGREEPLKGLKNKNWHEVGWTTDPHSYISASDVFILPNKATYFDIVMLEVLSLGRIVIASRTGGNKLFEEMNAEGVLLYDSLDEAKELIIRVQSLSQEERTRLGELNRKLYQTYFTSEMFYSNYRKLLMALYEEEKMIGCKNE